MSVRAFARSTVLFAAATFIPRLATFLLLPIYARFMNQADVGAFSLAISLAGLLAIVYRIGLDATLLRFHFDHEARLGRLYGTIFTVAAVAAGILATVSVGLLAPAFTTVFAGVAFIPVGLLAIGVAAGNAFQFVPFAWFRATSQAGNFLLCTIGGFVAAAAVTIWLVVVSGSGVAGALAGQLTSAALTIVVATFIVLRLPGRRFDPSIARSALHFGLPVIPHAVSGWVLNVSDRWLMALLLPVTAEAARVQIGVYWVGYQLGYAVALLAVSVQAAWLPNVYRQTDPARGARLVDGMAVLTVAALGSIAVGLIAVAPEAIALVAGDRYSMAVPILTIVALASVAYALYVVIVPVLLHTRRTGTLALITAVAGTVNVAINIVAIPTFGIVGAAAATLVANVAYAILVIVAARRHWPIGEHLPRIATIVAVAAVLGGMSLLQPGHFELWMRVAIAALFAVFAFWMARPATRGLALSA